MKMDMTVWLKELKVPVLDPAVYVDVTVQAVPAETAAAPQFVIAYGVPSVPYVVPFIDIAFVQLTGWVSPTLIVDAARIKPLQGAVNELDMV